MTFENGKSLTEAIRTVFSSNGGSEVVARVACYVLISPPFVSCSILFAFFHSYDCTILIHGVSYLSEFRIFNMCNG